MKILFLFSLLIIGLNFISCGKESKESKLIISFDETTKKKIEEMREKKKVEKEFGLSDPADINDIDCYGLMVTYPELPPINSCTVDQGTVVAVRPDVAKGLVAFPGGQLEMLVRSGPNRTLQLIGFKSEVGCPDMLGDLRSVEASMSKPFILGQLDGVELKPGEQSITMTASYSYGNTTRLTDCKGPMFGNMPLVFLLCGADQGCRHWLTTRVNERMHPDPLCNNPIAADNYVKCWQNVLGSEMRITADASAPLFKVDAGGTGKDMIQFDSNDTLKPAVGWIPPLEGSILVVFKHPTMTATETLIGVSESTREISLMLVNDSGNRVSAKIGHSILQTSANFVSDEVTVIFMSYRPGGIGTGRVELCINHNCIADSSLDYSLSPAINFPFNIGSRNFQDSSNSYYTSAHIGELIIFNRVLSPIEKDKAIELLKAAWGI